MKDNTKETLLKFPCEFQIKVVGLSGLDFEALVVGIMRKHIPALSEAAVKIRHSSDKKYVALSVTFQADNQAQLDELYRELSSTPEIIIAL